MDEKEILKQIRNKINEDGTLSEPLTEEETVWLRHASGKKKRELDGEKELTIIPGLFEDLGLGMP